MRWVLAWAPFCPKRNRSPETPSNVPTVTQQRGIRARIQCLVFLPPEPLGEQVPVDTLLGRTVCIPAHKAIMSVHGSSCQGAYLHLSFSPYSCNYYGKAHSSQEEECSPLPPFHGPLKVEPPTCPKWSHGLPVWGGGSEGWWVRGVVSRECLPITHLSPPNTLPSPCPACP